MEWIDIDGSQGEGGGQLLRTSLSLAMITGRPLRLARIRAGRKKPGLMRQHLACVRGSAEISCAQVEGDQLGSESLTFVPNGVKAGQYRFAIGTAGSTTLLAQTLLPALMLADQPSELFVEGGTHNGMAPSFHFFRDSFLPMLQNVGVACEAKLERAGFYPAGGGAWKLMIEPARELSALTVTDSKTRSVSATAWRLNLPGHICERELRQLGRLLNIANNDRFHGSLNGPGNGNMLSAIVRKGDAVNCFDGIGRIGLPAEKLARQLARPVSRFIKSAASVNEYLADQLLLPIALAGKGEFTTDVISDHTTTNISVIQRFLDVQFSIDELDSCFMVRCAARSEG